MDAGRIEQIKEPLRIAVSALEGLADKWSERLGAAVYLVGGSLVSAGGDISVVRDVDIAVVLSDQKFLDFFGEQKPTRVDGLPTWTSWASRMRSIIQEFSDESNVALSGIVAFQCDIHMRSNTMFLQRSSDGSCLRLDTRSAAVPDPV